MKLRWMCLAAALLPLLARAEKVEPVPAEMVPLAPHAVFMDLAFAGDRIVAVGERGIVVYSDDQGAHWTQAQVPVRGTLTSVAFVDARSGFAVGHDAVILKTTDAGAHWELVQFAPDAQSVYLTVRFRSPEWGYALGTNGQLLITQDGGGSWQAQTLAVEDWYQNHLFDVAWGANGTLVVAEKGILYRSDDGLTGWAPVTSPYEGSWFGALTLADGQFAIYGMSGRLFLSGDGGRTWRSVATGTQQFLLDGALLPDGRLLVAGAGGVISVVDPATGLARTAHRPDRVGITAVLLREGQAYLATTAGGVTALPLEQLLPR